MTVTAWESMTGVVRAALRFGRPLCTGFWRPGLAGFRSPGWAGAGRAKASRCALPDVFQQKGLGSIRLPDHQQSQGIPISGFTSAWITCSWGGSLRTSAQPGLADPQRRLPGPNAGGCSCPGSRSGQDDRRHSNLKAVDCFLLRY